MFQRKEYEAWVTTAEIGPRNVIYKLLDTKARQFYVVGASDLRARISQPHPSIPQWDFYRYDALPV
jgi:hypothetical protein